MSTSNEPHYIPSWTHSDGRVVNLSPLKTQEDALTKFSQLVFFLTGQSCSLDEIRGQPFDRQLWVDPIHRIFPNVWNLVGTKISLYPTSVKIWVESYSTFEMGKEVLEKRIAKITEETKNSFQKEESSLFVGYRHDSMAGTRSLYLRKTLLR